MANATAQVPSTTTAWGDDKVYRPCAAAATTYYVGQMMALDASGNAVHCDNTTGIRFDGILSGGVTSNNITVDSGDSAGDKRAVIERPWRFSMKIAAAVAGDEGKAVYAVYNNEVGYSTAQSIQVGWVDRVISATEVEITPIWSGKTSGGVVGFDAATLTFTGVTGGNTIVMPDNLADALSVVEGSNKYLTFTTTDSSELITLKKATLVNANSAIAFEVGPNGATNPTLKVVTSTSSAAGGLAITGAADAVGVALAALGSNTNEPLTLDAKGAGVISIGTVSTGGAVMRTKVATVAATGTVIGNAAAVVEGYTYVTGSNNVAGIQLPASVVGKVVRIQNTVGTALLLVYPPASSQINSKGVNNVYNCPNAATREFVCVSTTLWYSAPETIA